MGNCADGDTPVQIAPQAAQMVQVALLTTSTATAANHGKSSHASKSTASLGLPAPSTSTRKIRDMKKGDVVASRNPRTGKTEYKKVLQVFRHIAANLVAVSLADKRTGKIVEVVKATPEHPFFTAKGLVSAGQLGIGTELVTRAGPSASGSSGLVVKAVVPVKATIGKDGKRFGFVVYNLEVEDDHTYFVGSADGGAWVHNMCAGKNHFFPRFMGSKIPYGDGSLTDLTAADHTAFHDELADYLRSQTKNVNGQTVNMMYGAGNSGAVIQQNFSLSERTAAMRAFMQQYQGGSFLPQFENEVNVATANGWLN